MSQSHTSEAETLRCKRCGATLRPQAPTTKCPHHGMDSRRYAELFWDEV